MPRTAVNYTDNHTLTVPAFTLGDGLTCSGAGLHFNQVKRMPVEELGPLVDPGTSPHDRDTTLYNSRPFLYAQCRMLLEPNEMPSDKSNLGVLRAALWGAIQAGRTTPLSLLALERSANQQYNDMLQRIQNVISTTRYMPPVATSREDPGPQAKKTKRKRRSKESDDLSLASGMVTSSIVPQPQALPEDPMVPEVQAIAGDSAMSLDVPSLPPTDTPAVVSVQPEATLDPQPYKRGDRSAALNTELNRARRPRLTGKSYLLQIMVDPSKFTRAVEIIQSEPVPVVPSDLASQNPEAGLRTACVNLVEACASSTHAADIASYRVMLVHAELALWFLRVTETRPNFTVADAHRLLEGSDARSKCTENQFRSWRSYGHILLRLIHASSIHILLAIAVSTSRDVTDHLQDPTLGEVENALRQPDLQEGVLPGLIFTGIIAFVRHMKAAVPGGVRLGGHVLGVDQGEDDKLMAKWLGGGHVDIPQLPRGSLWYQKSSPFPPRRTFDSSTPPCPTKIIETNFDPELDGNRLLPDELARGKKDANIPFTESERQKALNATCPETLEALETEACAQLYEGVKKPDSYIKVLPELFATSNILIHGVGGKEKGLVCFILSSDTLTPAEKEYLLLITRLTLELKGNEVVDTKVIGPWYTFEGYHYGVWGKMSKSGKLAPKRMHPRVYLGESSQATPYLDRAVRLLASHFNVSHFLHCPQAQFNSAIELILQPALAKLKEQIPGLVVQHQTLFDSLNPAMHRLGSAPFCMTVLNVQPMTRAHRDASDQIDSICLILALGDFEDGDLCLYSSGFWIPLPHGTFMAILSKRDLHFNLHFKGQRFLYVFTSYGALWRWAEYRNHMRWLQTDANVTEESDEQMGRDEETDEDVEMDSGRDDSDDGEDDTD